MTASPSIKFAVVLLGVLVNFNYLNIPLPGGETKPLYALLALPLLLVFMMHTKFQKIDLWAIIAVSILLIHTALYSIIGCAECALARLFAIMPGIIMLLLLRRILSFDTKLFETFLKALIFTGILIVIYSLIAQGFLSSLLNEVRTFDYHLRGVLLVRARDHGKLTLLDAEPSFAAFHLILLYATTLAIRRKMSNFRFNFFSSATLTAFIFTQSITALLLLTPYLASNFLRQRNNLKILFRLLIASAIFFMFFLSISDRFFSDSQDLSTGARFLLAYSTILAWLDSPILGIGLGQYSVQWQQYIDLDIVNAIPQALEDSIYDSAAMIKPFSMIGGYLAELGLIGAVAVFLTYQPRLNAKIQYGLANWIAIVAMLLTAYPISLPYVFVLIAITEYEQKKDGLKLVQ